jgi:hypothetical protein
MTPAVIASEAKQSRGHKQELDCFVAALLAMTILGDGSYSARAVLRTRLASVWIRKIAKLGSSCSMN